MSIIEKKIEFGTGVFAERVVHSKDKRFVVNLVWDGDQLLREFPRGMEKQAMIFGEAYAMAKAVYGVEHIPNGGRF